MRIARRTIVLLVMLIFFSSHAEAQERNGSLFARNRLSAQFVAGALFSPVSWLRDHPTFNYAQTNLRFGWMAGEPARSKYFGTGNFELLFELTNSVVFQGAGNYLRGFTLLGRYNLILSDPEWAIYFQVGAGVVVNDVYRDMSQSAIGQAIEFTPQAGIGLHCFIGRNWSIDAEAMFHHISNAGISNGRNGGTNAFGGFLGVTYFFDRLWC